MPTENLSVVQAIILACIQGLTEFLPISSSAHLLLPRVLLGWPEQGLAFDVLVHLGSLLAVILYFRQDIKQLTTAWFWSSGQLLNGRVSWFGRVDPSIPLDHRQVSGQATLAWLLIIATLPAGVAGLLWQDAIALYARDARVLAATSIGFGLVLLVADRVGTKSLELTALNWKTALIIGCSQALALIPGTSRSGVTMSAALLAGFSRVAATRFAFLMAIPIIAASSLLELNALIAQGVDTAIWLQLLLALAVSAMVAFACIHYFLQVISRIGFLPFVIYRLCLGLLLLWSL